MVQPRFISLAVLGLVAATATALPTLSGRAADKPKPFDLISPAFRDGGMLGKKFAGNNASNKNCDGENVSPPLRWSNAPANTKSFAIMLQDTTGRAPLGFVHWLAYGIPAAKTGLKEGEASTASADIVGGKGTAGLPTYSGPCPPIGDKPHPYVFTLIATDLAPNAVTAGLNRDELGAALNGHILGSTGLISRYGH